MSEANDSLQSKAVLSILDLLGEGPIGGLVGASEGRALQSVFLNDTPIQNANGSLNFQGVSWNMQGGDNTQPVMPGFGNYVEAPYSVGVQIKTTTPYTFTVDSPNTDSVRLIINVPSLAATDATNGDIHGATVQYKFSMLVVGGPGATGGQFVDQGEIQTISGKSRSLYQRNHILHIPQPHTSVQIRVTRVTPDSTSSYLQNDTYLSSYAEIVTLNMMYPNSAVFGLRIDSQQFNQVPNRSYLLDGLYIRVPTNYNPVTHTYSGIWNGTFKYAVSNNPAWIMFDVLTHKRYGLGNFISDSQVDKASLYTIGRYCDELVPDGRGGMEPRFTLNTVISSQVEAFKFISDIASVFRGMGFWDGGMVNFTQDAPGDPLMLYTSANVVGGDFTYMGSARKDRHSVVHVTWNDPSDNYKKKVEYVEDTELVNLYGVKKLDTLAFGCTSRGQAARVGKWVLYTEKFESDLINFKVGIDSAFVMPGNIVKIHDTARAGRRVAGRLAAWTSVNATLDSPVTIDTVPATISIMMPDGTFVDRTLTTGVGTHSIVWWAQALPASPVDNAVWMISEPNLVPILARVVGVGQGQNSSEYEITALEHNPSKFAAIESGLILEDRATSIIDPSFVQVPSQLSVSESIYRAAPGVYANQMFVSWYGNSSQHDVAYRGTGTSNISNWTTVRVTNSLSLEIKDAAIGPYEITVTGINPLGKRSETVTTSYTVTGKLTPPSNVATVFATANDQGVEVSWVPILDEDLKYYEVRACSFSGQPWETSTVVAQTIGTTYQSPPPAAGLNEWLVKAVNTNNNYSAVATRLSFTVVAPAATTVSYNYVLSDIVVSWAPATSGSLPIKHYIVKRGATWATAVDVGITPDTSYKTPVKWTTSQTFWVAAVDIANNVATPASVNAVFSLPAAPVITNTQKETNFVLDWTTPAASLSISSYEVRFGSSFATGTKVASISGTQITLPITWIDSRTFFVAAVDINGNVGVAGSRVLSVVAPRAPANFTSTYNQGQVTLGWSDSRETLPVNFYEIRRGALWETGTLVGKAYTNTLTLEVSWMESATFTFRATDVNGNLSAIGTFVSSVTAPGAVSVAHQFKDGNVILTWAAPSTGALPIRHYEIRSGTTWATGTVIGITSDRLYSIPVNWTSSKTFFVAAVDTAGNYGPDGSEVVTYTGYAAPTSLSAAVAQASLTLSWQPAVGGSLGVDYYDIRYGADWLTGEVIGKSNTTTITLPITWLGSRKLWVTAVDTNGQYGTPASVTSNISAPSAPSASVAIVVAKAELTWTAPSSSLPIKEYEIRHGASFAAGTLVARTLATSYRAPVEWVGDRTYWIAARDVNDNVGTADSAIATISIATAPSVSGAFALDEFKLSWTEPTATLPIEEYEIRYGATWASGTVLGRVKGTTISTKAQWVGARTWWVAAIDVNGNVGAQGSANLVISAPPAPSVTQQVVDNNVLLYWTQPPGTLPITTHDIRRGPTWATAQSIGQKSGGFTTVFETVAGTYTYWVAAIDSAGNEGAPSAVTTSVSQPPDYALLADNDLTFAGTKSNMYLDTDGTYIMPVNTTETFAQHFTTRSWTTPDAQIAAGYPVFIQPANSPGYYEEVIDYGTPIGGTKISVTPTGNVVAGTPALTIEISVKLNAGDAWTTYPNTSSVFVNNFRYAKVRFTVSGDNLSLYRLQKLNVKLDTKIRNEAGMESGSATDAVSGTDAIVNGVSLTGVNPPNSFGNRVQDGAGTMVRFTTPFIDISSIEVSLAAGSSARYALYDFVDGPNPAGFKVLLYDGSGNRVAGAFSWSVKGY